MQEEFKDATLKFKEMCDAFRAQTFDLKIAAGAHNRACEQLAKRLAQERPKTRTELERNEYMRDFVIKAAQLNDQALGMIDYYQGLINSICVDSEALEAARVKDIVRLQSETIIINAQRELELVKTIKELKDELRRKNTPAAE